MGNFRPLPLKCWEAFLTHMGFVKDRITASHHQWTKTGFRTVPVWGNEKEIPAQHLKSSCATMGTNLQALYAWADKNC